MGRRRPKRPPWRETFSPRVVTQLEVMTCPHGHEHAWQCVGCKRYAVTGAPKWLEWGR